MGTPGFTAGTSLYKTGATYRSAGLGASAYAVPPGGMPHVYTCDNAGSRCCGPDGAVRTRHCHRGLGCNIATDHCEPCGAAGQVCCDGDFTGFSGLGYSGHLRDPRERIESCDPGLRCDAVLAADGISWTGTRRCQPCGSRLGGACCAPDNRNALGRCWRDAATGVRLVCDEPWAGAGGHCVACGQSGQPRCLTAGEAPCDDGLSLRDSDGLCVPCGWAGLPTCDRGEPCRDGRSVPDRSSTRCLPAGGPNQPCRPDGQLGGCDYQGLFCNGAHLCEPCGTPGAACCPPGRLPGNAACQQPGECRDGRCFACGYDNMPVCHEGEPCRSLSQPDNGWCRPCGHEGQACCSSSLILGRCLSGLACADGTCRRPAPPPPPPPPPQWKTCSGANWSLSTIDRTVFVRDGASQCIGEVHYAASSAQEAYGCARRDHGTAVVTDTIYPYKFALTSAYGCHTVNLLGTDDASARACAQWQCLNCSVSVGDCP